MWYHVWPALASLCLGMGIGWGGLVLCPDSCWLLVQRMEEEGTGRSLFKRQEMHTDLLESRMSKLKDENSQLKIDLEVWLFVCVWLFLCVCGCFCVCVVVSVCVCVSCLSFFICHVWHWDWRSPFLCLTTSVTGLPLWHLCCLAAASMSIPAVRTCVRKQVCVYISDC